MNLRSSILLYGTGTREGALKAWDTRGRGRRELEKHLKKQGFAKLPFEDRAVGYAFRIPAKAKVDLGSGPDWSEMGLRVVYDPKTNSYGMGPAAHMTIKYAMDPQASAFFDETPRGNIYEGDSGPPYVIMDAPSQLFDDTMRRINFDVRRSYQRAEINYAEAIKNMPRFTWNGQRVHIKIPGWGREDAERYRKAVGQVVRATL